MVKVSCSRQNRDSLADFEEVRYQFVRVPGGGLRGGSQVEA